MSTEAALRAAIEASPHDEAARQVYADWLLGNGDPRGDLLTVQLARQRDPWWLGPRLERRERRLALPGNQLFDRGEQGATYGLAELDLARFDPPRWIQLTWPYRDRRIPAGTCEAQLAALRVHPGFCRVNRLDLYLLVHEAWPMLLRSAARPKRVALPHEVAKQLDALVDAPLLSEVEQLDLGRELGDAEVARLVAAPWARNITTMVCRPSIITDEGFAALARLPRLARLDARLNAITPAGIAALVAARPPLVELQLSVDGLGTAGLAALERSPYAGVTRVSVDGSRPPSPDTIVALTRSPCWDGTLDLLRVPHHEHHVELTHTRDILDALVTEPAGRLRAVRLGHIGIDLLVRAPLARTLQHLDAIHPEPFDGGGLQLATVRIAGCSPELLRSPALAGLRGLSLHAVQPVQVAALAASSLRPVDLEVDGTSTTDATCALARSAVLERVSDLTLALRGNHAAAPVTAALLDTPYLQDVQQLELDFLSTFPAAKRARLAARYGRVLR